MDLDESFISRIELLVPSSRLNSVMNALLIALHAFVGYYVVSTIGEPYRLVVEELAQEAARNGTALTLDAVHSTEDQPLPGEFSPSPVAAICMMVSVGLHVLFFLVQRWSVGVRIFMQFKRVSSVLKAPTHACMYPPDFRGRPEIVELVMNKSEVSSYWFSFQRRKFELTQDSVRLLSFPIAVPVASFVSSHTGIKDIDEVKKRQSLYGKNAVDIPVPPFWKLYVEQLLSPIPIFQLFCSALWMLDEYMKYTLFTLLSIFGFEVSTTVQRKRSLETLRSMSAKSVVSVSVLRSLQWTTLSSDQLVPGDRIRLIESSVVPCDCLIVSGSAVVNEASLTGESVPQMKDAVDTDRTDVLDMQGRDRIHCLFSGTTIVRADADVELIALRTGAQSSQGELLRMVEFSQQQVSGDKKDTMYLLLLLLVFALAAAGYVVYERLSGTGSENLTKMKTHKLMLRVIMIVTSVVPPELPMQLSLSVNTALIALNRIGIFCTEPFRVPMAGTVTHCFFDKTGTLTSDHLECHGFAHVADMRKLELVVAGCHSLTTESANGGKLIGDPIELTAIEKVGFTYNATTSTATSGKPGGSVKILQRFHFSSALQRMSCVVVDGQGKFWAVVKGSPEAVLAMLTNPPTTYTAEYEKLAHAGKRVLALAYKPLADGKHVHRDFVESKLEFAGFASFACETRADSRTVVKALTENAELGCIMVTGDALLTSVHVAKQVAICRSDAVVLKLVKGPSNKLQWESLSTANGDKRVIVFDPLTVEKLGREFDLVVSGEVLSVDESELQTFWSSGVQYVRVFARLSPQQKERVIGAIKLLGGKPLMCGDGGNDVGALKQADVGVALLANFGSLNTAAGEEASADSSVDVEEKLDEDNRVKALKEKHLGAKMKAEFDIVKKRVMAQQQVWLQLEMAKPNNGGYWNCIKIVTAKMREELAVESKKIQAKYGAASWASAGALTAGAGAATDTKERPTIQMGDASVAAPFTSRAPSIRAVVQIVKQGRCTLLIAVQMMQIMMLESLISAYTFAAITMEGGRSTEIQMIGSSVFVMVASIAFTYAKPAKRLSNVLPLKSVFHPAIFISVVCQVLLHLAVLVFAMSWAKTVMGPNALTDLYAFEREREEKLTKLMAAEPSEDASWLAGMDMLSMFRSVPYTPNLLNTVMFLVKTSQQVSVLVVNYKGSPWMQGALENKALFISMFACGLGITVCASGYIPAVNSMLELLVVPAEMRSQLYMLLLLSTIGTFVLDRLVVAVFAPKIFRASTIEPLMKTTIADFIPIVKMCGYIAGGVVVAPILLGNPIGLIGAFFMFKQYKKWQQDRETAELAKKFPSLFEATPAPLTG